MRDEILLSAVLIDPARQSIERIPLAAEPNPDNADYASVVYEALQDTLGCKRLENTYLQRGVALVVPEAMDDGCSDRPVWCWRYGPECEPIGCKAILFGHDIVRDHCFNFPLKLSEFRDKVIFDRRLLKGFQTDTYSRDGATTIVTRQVTEVVEDA